MTAFTKPVNSFNPPNQPKLPGGWKIPEGEMPAPVSASPGGERRRPVRGAVGVWPATAPPGRVNALRPARLQLTGRPTANRGDDPKI